jgi:hypothetical protein
LDFILELFQLYTISLCQTLAKGCRSHLG